MVWALFEQCRFFFILLMFPVHSTRIKSTTDFCVITYNTHWHKGVLMRHMFVFGGSFQDSCAWNFTQKLFKMVFLKFPVIDCCNVCKNHFISLTFSFSFQFLKCFFIGNLFKMKYTAFKFYERISERSNLKLPFRSGSLWYFRCFWFT